MRNLLIYNNVVINIIVIRVVVVLKFQLVTTKFYKFIQFVF